MRCLQYPPETQTSGTGPCSNVVHWFLLPSAAWITSWQHSVHSSSMIFKLQLHELQVKELCHTRDTSVTHWAISCSLQQFWPWGCSWKRKLQLGAGITVVIYTEDSNPWFSESTGKSLSKYSPCLQLKALVSSKTKSFGHENFTIFMHILPSLTVGCFLSKDTKQHVKYYLELT